MLYATQNHPPNPSACCSTIATEVRHSNDHYLEDSEPRVAANEQPCSCQKKACPYIAIVVLLAAIAVLLQKLHTHGNVS